MTFVLGVLDVDFLCPLRVLRLYTGLGADLPFWKPNLSSARRSIQRLDNVLSTNLYNFTTLA